VPCPLARREDGRIAGLRQGKLARELREVLAELANAELAPANLELLEGIEL
jgi:hypothetical protein